MVAVILALFIRTFVVQAFKIPTGSMETNLLIGDHLLVNKLVYSPSRGACEDALLAKSRSERGHVVVFKFPEDPQPRLHQARDRPARARRWRSATRRATSTASRWTRAYVHFLEPPLQPRRPRVRPARRGTARQLGPEAVPPGKLFVLGDNRDNSRDSRFWGFLPRDQVKGRALLVYWSYEATREEYHRTGCAAGSGTRWPPSARPAGTASST